MMNYQQVYIWGSKNIDIKYIKLIDTQSIIPNDPDNTDWQQYQAWLAQGNKPLPPEGAK